MNSSNACCSSDLLLVRYRSAWRVAIESPEPFEPFGRECGRLTTILSPMRLASRLTAGVSLAITACWALALAFDGSTDVLLFLAPALLILAPLVAGRYVGEGLIVRLAAKRTRKPRRAPASAAPSSRPSAIWLPRGTGLLAFSLAERPPPPRLLTEF
jgi:hypothetical protein